jgi:hypothetical protein
MSQETEKVSTRKTTGRIGGASIAWVTLFGALIGVTGLIPIFPYVGGGGYVPLATPFAAIAPLLLGPIGGIVAAIIGGVIGMFIAPAAYPLQLVDVVIGAAAPAILVALLMKNKTLWKINAPVFVGWCPSTCQVQVAVLEKSLNRSISSWLGCIGFLRQSSSSFRSEPA